MGIIIEPGYGYEMPVGQAYHCPPVLTLCIPEKVLIREGISIIEQEPKRAHTKGEHVHLCGFTE
jgi:hypothetical protein